MRWKKTRILILPNLRPPAGSISNDLRSLKIYNFHMNGLQFRIKQFLGAFPKIAKSDYEHRHICQSVAVSVRLSAQNNSAPSGRIFLKFDISVFFENISR